MWGSGNGWLIAWNLDVCVLVRSSTRFSRNSSLSLFAKRYVVTTGPVCKERSSCQCVLTSSNVDCCRTSEVAIQRRRVTLRKRHRPGTARKATSTTLSSSRNGHTHQHKRATNHHHQQITPSGCVGATARLQYWCEKALTSSHCSCIGIITCTGTAKPSIVTQTPLTRDEPTPADTFPRCTDSSFSWLCQFACATRGVMISCFNAHTPMLHT